MHPLYLEFEQVGRQYLAALDRYNEGPFVRTPKAGGWSMGEMYMHLGDASLKYMLAHCEKCLDQRDGKVGPWRSLATLVVLARGKFLRKRLKPHINDKYPPVVPKNIAEARSTMLQVLKKAQELAERLPTANKKYKTKHFALGWLNAEQWYKLNTMHARHHLGQQKRLEREIIKDTKRSFKEGIPAGGDDF